MSETESKDLLLALDALRNAVNNGELEIMVEDPETTAWDLGTYCQALEGREVSELVPLVEESLRILRIEQQSAGSDEVCEHIRSLESYMRANKLDVRAEHAEEPLGWCNVYCKRCGRCFQIRLATEMP